MKFTPDHLAQKLAFELGRDCVTAEAGAREFHTIDGLQPMLVCLPETAEQLAAGLRVCSEAGATVAPYGGGTAMAIGNAARQMDVVFDLTRFNRVIEHDDANLTATVGAGTGLSALQVMLARQKQFLPFEPPHPDRATTGGTIAANLNGPRRSYYGSVRDLVIGMKLVLASGEPIKAGGKVVKNVAGYDMCKLFVGSLGTLGMITQVTLRTAPIPETAATLIASGAAERILKLANDIAHAPLLPAAVVILNPLASQEMNSGDLDWKLAVGSEGFAETVGRHARDAKALAERIGLRADLLHNHAHSQFWARFRDYPLPADRLVFRVIVPLASIAHTMATVESWHTDGFYPALAGDAMAGILWIVARPGKAAASQFHKLVALAAEQRGHAVMFAAPSEWKQEVDVWGLPPAALALMRKIKQQFDPHGMLSPGRHVSGI
jgi:glycolate dehydrogenase FAD-binding subunit